MGYLRTLVPLLIVTCIIGVAFAILVQHQAFTPFASNARLPLGTSTTAKAGCVIPKDLLGIWQEVDLTNGDTPDGFSLELNPDGTFADKQNGVVAIYSDAATSSGKTTGGFTYSDFAATSTGLWSLVTNPAKEMSDRAQAHPSWPYIYLPDNSLILKEEFGDGPWYYIIKLQYNCTMLTQTAAWIEDDPGYTYRRTP